MQLMDSLYGILKGIRKNYNFLEISGLPLSPNAMNPGDCDCDVAYKCHFCGVIFLKLQSILKHNRDFCHRRHKLPRSCTVTTATLSSETSFDGNIVLRDDCTSQSLETAVTGSDSEPKSTSGEEASPLKDFIDVTTPFQHEDAQAKIAEVSADCKLPSSAKRKRPSDEEEPATDIISPRKQLHIVSHRVP